jgi:hypothetical protein
VERVLVCVLAQTHAHQLTFPRFKRQVLDELNADLAVALAIDENYDYANPFWQHAKYRWTASDFSDYGEAFDLAQRWLCEQRKIPPPDWRLVLRIQGLWQGGIRSRDPQRTAASILFFCRWLLLRGLQQDDVLDRYDRFVITRSDFVWLCPHPPLSILDRDAIWFPDGEHHGGLNDRHLIVSRADVVNCLNIIEDILLEPRQLYEELRYMEGRPFSENNLEQFSANHLRRKGVFHKAKMFPYVMYLARLLGDNRPTWSMGYYEPEVGHYVKYVPEFRLASAYATVIKSRKDWEDGAWRQFNPEAAASSPVFLPRHMWYACVRTTSKILSALKVRFGMHPYRGGGPSWHRPIK